MPEPEQNRQSDFMIEKIKQHPINKKKLIRRTLITAAMAVIFGLIACFTFLVLEPVISNLLYPEEDSKPVTFPEDQEEMSPEEMLAGNMQQENQMGEMDPPSPDQEQIQEILNEVSLNTDHYEQLYNALYDYVYRSEDVDGTISVSQYIVTIRGVTSNVDWFDNIQESSNQTTGVIIYNNEKEFLILVDYTPLRNTQNLVMELSEGVYQVPARLKGLDPATDLAVVAVELEDIPAEWMETGGLEVAPMGTLIFNGNMLGKPVIAMGSPMGVSDSLGYGMITAWTTLNNKPDVETILIQTDIYGSNSASGFLFDLYGNLVGVITTRETVSGMENVITAYRMSELRGRIQKLSNEEEIPYLGISGVAVPWIVQQNQGVPRGIYITKVEMDSPAMMAGIQPGDVLTGMDDISITSFSGYSSRLLQHRPGDTMKLLIMRQSQNEYRELKFNIVLESVSQ
ncbi:MAG: PDZ domain-containing protein [Acetatifactor sp.]|nr:PDZ domain-containing protein [Acetatifactor sp.]